MGRLSSCVRKVGGPEVRARDSARSKSGKEVARFLKRHFLREMPRQSPAKLTGSDQASTPWLAIYQLLYHLVVLAGWQLDDRHGGM